MARRKKHKKKAKSLLRRLNPFYILAAVFLSLVSFVAGFQFNNYYSPKPDIVVVDESEEEVEEFPEKVVITRIVDGDTVEIADKRDIRYIGVNTPERGKEEYKTAIELNRKLVEGKEIRLEYGPRYKIDQYDRILAYPWVKPDPGIKTLSEENEDGEINVSIELVRQGLGTVAVYKGRAKLIHEDELFAAQDLAKKEKLGIWTK